MSVLQQLPMPPAVFVDRAPALRSIVQAFDEARAGNRTALVAVHGAVGVGVRSLVRKSYWDRPARFANGAIRVRLGDPVHRDPQALGDAIGSVLVDLGVPPAELPASIEDRQKRLLTKTFPLSVLLVLEEVTSAAQVEPFLLNSPTSVVVVISRSRIRRLTALGFVQVAVEPLEPKFGLELFEEALGPSWCSVDDVRPESVVRACGGYPLAIRTTAAQLATTPDWEVAELIRQLSQRGLSALDQDSQEYVRESFDRAYDGLSAEIGQAYRLVVGLHPGNTITIDSASVLLGARTTHTRDLLAALASAQLLTRVAADRFEFHDVAHWHARDCVERDESVEDRAAAARRITTAFLDAAVHHDRALSRRPRVGPRYQELDNAEPPARSEALAWLEDHLSALRAAVVLAERYRLDELSWQLCEAIWGVCHLHGHFDDWITTHRIGVAAAARLRDHRASMRMCSQLGSALLRTCCLDDAQAMFAESLRLAGVVGDAAGKQSALEWLGKIEAARGRNAAALDLMAASWRVAETEVEADLRPRMFAVLRLNRGRALAADGRREDAVTEVDPAVDYFAGTDETDNLAKTLMVRATAGACAADARRAAELFRADGSLQSEAAARELLLSLGVSAEERAGCGQRLLEIYAQLGDPRAVRE